MNRLVAPVAIACLFAVAACGSSNSGKSGNANCTPAKNPQFAKIQGIRSPGGVPSPAGNGPTTPGSVNVPTVGNDTANTDCDPAQPGNLGDNPTVPNMPNQPNNPTAPGTGAPRTPTLNTGNINGRWEFSSEFCEDGTQSPDMQATMQMMLNGNFNHSLTINNSTVDEYFWTRMEVNGNSEESMMCTLMRKSTLTRTGNTFKMSRPSASFDDAGGTVTCNLKPVPAETVDNMRIVAQGSAMVIEILNSKECNGKSRLQLYTNQPGNRN
jgi:hypothetical protein